MSWTEYARAVERVGTHLGSLRLHPAEGVAIVLPAGPQAAVALLAVEAAGLRPCLLPLALDENSLAASLESVDARAVITQGRFGDLRPAALVCGLAAASFRLRAVLAFGPDIPDGVLDLDGPVALGCGGARTGPSGEAVVTTLAPSSEGSYPVSRTGRSLLAAAAVVMMAIGLRQGDRIVSLVAPDDLMGLATGPVGSLVAGAALELHASLPPDLLEPGPSIDGSHLIVPSWLEPVVRDRGLHRLIRSLVVVHAMNSERPCRPEPDGDADRNIHLLAFGEQALLPARRGKDGRFTLDAPRLPHWLDWAVHDGHVHVRGIAAGATRVVQMDDAPDVTRWQRLGDARDVVLSAA